jgi:hypothetical protein
VLEAIAFSNYYLPRPQLIDAATLFDLVKIRRLVDDATDLAVRAANGTTSSALGNAQNASNGLFAGGSAAALGLGRGAGGANAKLSRERKHRMREHASQKLSHAYHLDEIAASVATMQSASALEDVAKHVLTRNQHDPDATYVHFFHEKIPSRSLAECTSLAPLDQVIRHRPTDGAPYRTRAVTRIFKEDYLGAVSDLTEALRLCRLFNPQHERPNEQIELVLARQAAREQRADATVDEKDQPSGLEAQLLFHRAGTYLTMACDNIATALNTPAHSNGEAAAKPRSGAAGATTSPNKIDREAQLRRVEARKLVRTYAKRALRDYTAFISRFDYTPGQPAEITQAFLNKINAAANGHGHGRGHGRRSHENRLLDMADFPITARSSALIKRHPSPPPPHKPRASQTAPLPPSAPVYALNELFAAVPPADLPVYPPESTTLTHTNPHQHHHHHHPSTDHPTTETLTYHPLLTDALHSLLLTHTLIQTPRKELLRHAHMVARLTRLSDGFPVFLPARSPARADWSEVLRLANNSSSSSSSSSSNSSNGAWLTTNNSTSSPSLFSWDQLCAPPPLPGHAQSAAASSSAEAAAAAARIEGETAEQRRERARREAIRDALADERVVDEDSFRRCVRAREARTVREEKEEEQRRRRLQLREGGVPGDADGGGGGVGGEAGILDADADGDVDTKLRRRRAREDEGAQEDEGGKEGGGEGEGEEDEEEEEEEEEEEGNEYRITTERAEAIARWIREAPLPGETGGRAAAGGAGARKSAASTPKSRLARARKEDVGVVHGHGHGDGDGEADNTSVLDTETEKKSHTVVLR